MSFSARSIPHNVAVTLEMIKWEHSFLTLPFGLTGMALAAKGWPSWRVFLWIVVALIAARSAAMAFNRLVDADIDRTNPRTEGRALPAGLLTRGFVAGFTVVCSLVFFFAAWMLNPLSFWLSPAALAVVCGYSYAKRVTRWAHLALGLAMGIAPAAAWIAVRGSLEPRILWLATAVMFWGAGFDVLYSCQDYEHDCRERLHSIPRFFGIAGALKLARWMHLIAFVCFAAMWRALGLGGLALAGVVVVGALLVHEHRLLKADDLSRMNAAFFTTNGLISAGLFCVILVDRLLAR